MRRALSRSIAALVAVVAAVALVGCGSGGNVLEASSGAAAAVRPAATPAFLAESAQRTVALRTGKVDVQVTAAEGTVTLSGQFDTSAPSASATLHTEGMNEGLLGDIDAEVVFDDGVVYVKPDGLLALLGAAADTPWLSFDVGDAGGFAEGWPGGIELPDVDPATLLDDLQAEGIQVTEVGREDVRGVATTHYAVTPSPDGTSPFEGGTADVWIDDDGLVRRVEGRVDASAAGQGEVTLRAELYDLGEPVSITVPPADQVTDLGSVGELFGNRPR
jgi:hypothetical protein